ncbi:hypothetical protein GOD45_16690 [Sinorhizobium medicae]|nr:hypothetical protein [Sinorhizobium medicae]
MSSFPLSQGESRGRSSKTGREQKAGFASGCGSAVVQHTRIAENTATGIALKVATLSIANDAQGATLLSLSGADAPLRATRANSFIKPSIPRAPPTTRRLSMAISTETAAPISRLSFPA